MSQLILQLFRCFTYVTVHSTTLLSLLLRRRLFSYVTWRAAHGDLDSNDEVKISGHTTVEQATTVSFTEMKEGGGSTNAFNINNSCARERVNTFSVSLQNFVSSCSS